ncbi:MAG: uroporphyrinogen-III synthase [Alphaproteobacteria bacterium]|nr:uroporphyrinogen-III synthase [Alphaproteobacteria bacterium]
MGERKNLALNFSVLLTRPEPVLTKTTSLFEAKGIDVIKEPMMEIIPVKSFNLKLEPYQAILSTSSMAIRAFAELSRERDIPLWCVGEISKQTALELGFKNVYTPKGPDENAESLIATLKETLNFNQGSLLYIRGDHIQTDLKGILNRFGYIIDSMILYKSRAKERFSNQAKDFLLAKDKNSLSGITFLSVRTVDIFLKLCQKEGIVPQYERFIALSLSGSISKELEQLPWFKIITASTTAQLIANLIEIIQKGEVNDNHC